AAAVTVDILDILRENAQSNDIAIMAGLPYAPDKDRPRNSLFVIPPDGEPIRYDKLHLFPPFEEPEHFTPGQRPVLATLNLSGIQVAIGPMICYDIRFPELARRYSWSGCQLLVVSALWPLSRQDNFITLVRARAMENQCFVAATNACGVSQGVELAGSSIVVAPSGQILCQADKRKEELLVTKIVLEQIPSARSFFNSSWPRGAWNYPVQEKICSLSTLKRLVSLRKRAGQRLVFTNGCFDILHPGHVSYLRKARNLGDFLVVGLNSDSSVRAIKGPSRPINSQEHRATVLAALAFVDFVVLFDEETPQKLIEELEPDILVKGADWEINQIVGADFVLSRGGEVVRIPFEEDISTTKIISTIKNKNQKD
ncbi:MAG: D-glycero-beta-D-manno-heptose 1-phosphate adenylyltransferase, partial [Thermodesulfobacteria bacterium]|nr:D-glycero-beta-D-manno-heptose 1-phosphate adenylyltransferase [Thermodesulfobacteriota bacterium]